MAEGIGDRMKRYEAVSRGLLAPNTPVFIRVDGRSFHTYTKRFQRPFDRTLMEAMVYAAQRTAADMHGFVMGYAQSDEVTFVLSDYFRPETQGWFGYEVSKLVSLSASLFTANFNAHIARFGTCTDQLATFDSRAFNVPHDDAPNVFVWRQKDWERNWVSMLARTHFSAKQLHGVSRSETLALLGPEKINVPDDIKYGTFFFPDGTTTHEYADYAKIQGWMSAPK